MMPTLIKTHVHDQYHGYQHHTHRTASTAQELAAAEHVSGYRVAKSVVLKMSGELAIAVVAATDRVDLTSFEKATGSRAQLVPESEFSQRFHPCAPGSEPPLAIFGAPIFVDDKLLRERMIVMPAGTHEDALVLDTAEWSVLERVQPIAGLGRRGP